MPSSQKLSATEIATLIVVALMLALGFILFYTDLSLFLDYVEEDHLVEWLTVAGLLGGCFVCLSRFIKLFRRKSWWFLTVTLVLGLLLFFAAGEEVSWGQRIFHIRSSAFFEKNNAQHEMNFHNLVVGGVKINKLVFSIGLIVCLGLYLVVLPLLYQKSKAIKTFADNSGIAVPQLYQIISFVVLFGIVSLLKHEKNAELLECGAAILFFLILAYPKNRFVFVKSQGL